MTQPTTSSHTLAADAYLESSSPLSQLLINPLWVGNTAENSSQGKVAIVADNLSL